ncbi:SDR family NAD(P)-dependent oxidoreductase [Terrabacter terrigena]|uniref:SDR family NAD(P)-dependent oxidoreductase n=1 Tax=Terrabacter terrigena TaxID=574718 RepID=A0ABW3N147_9MICO
MENRVAVITGASRGLGRAIAIDLAAHATHVILAARDVASLDAVAQSIGAGAATVVAADVSDPAGMQALVDHAVGQFGRLDVFVNNAGVAPQSSVEQTTDQEWARVVDINLNAAFRSARALAPVYREAGSGRLINIASVFGLLGRSGFGAYGASKAGLINLSRVLAAEWAKFGAQVNVVAPGYISTDINAEIRENEAFMKRVVSRIPAKRMGEAHEVANLVRYLALDAPDFLTGQVIAIDGGESAS